MKNRIKHLHFVGIGGVGMSGIAELMHHRGFEVSGSDLAAGRMIDNLRASGIQVSIGHDAAHLQEADVVVRSTAIDAGNPEIIEAGRRGIPVISRAEMLAEAMRGKQGIAISGTHGKTTTTALVSHILVEAGHDPTALVGGWVQRGAGQSGGAVIGEGDWLVTEADESDGSFLHLHPSISVVTNIDADHLDHYGGMGALEDAFLRFANNLPFWGAAILCTDHARVRTLADKVNGRVVRYGIHSDADLRAQNIQTNELGMQFAVEHEGTAVGSVDLPLPGTHNIENALAAIAVVLEVGVPFEVAAEAIAGFRGVARRFELKGSEAGVRVVDDYGHHPIEVQATLEAARAQHTGRIVTIFQPHRFSRTRDCMSEFSGAFFACDVLIVGDTYAAGEAPIKGASAEDLTAAIQTSGHADARYVGTLSENVEAIGGLLRDGDLVLTLGAGDVTRLGPQLLDFLAGGART